MQEALASFDRALEIRPNYAEALNNRGVALRTQGKIDEAVKMLHTVLASDPDNQDAHYLLFGLYRDAGQTAEARRELQIFQELKRKDTEREQKRMRLDSIN